jgi:hypothetical protein
VTPDADRFRRADGVVELRYSKVRMSTTTLAMWGALLLVLALVGLFVVDSADRLTVLLITAGLAVATAAVVFDARHIGLLIDGDRVGYRSGWRNGDGKWWVDLDDVVEVQLDGHRPTHQEPVTNYVLFATGGGMPKTQAFSIGHPSIPCKRDMKERIDQGYHAFSIPRSALDDERAAIVDEVLEPLIRTKGRQTTWN